MTITRRRPGRGHVNGKRIADTASPDPEEAAHSACEYIPRKDVDIRNWHAPAHQTYCPYKGECAYYSIRRRRTLRSTPCDYENPYAGIGNPGNTGV